MPIHCIAERSPRLWHETHPYCLGCAQHTERPSLEADWIKPALESIGSGVFVCPNFVALPVEEIAGTASRGASVGAETGGVCGATHVGTLGAAGGVAHPLGTEAQGLGVISFGEAA